MSEWIRAVLDIVLIALVGAGIVQAMRLMKNLAGLQQSRAEMAQFIGQFGQTVDRANDGIKNLKLAARESGDDLEKLIERGTMLRDELTFIVESADQLATRIAQTKAAATAAAAAASAPAAPERTATKEPAAAKAAAPAPRGLGEGGSRAEQELLQALEKMG